MVTLSTDPQTPLMNLILAKGITDAVYVNNETPSSGLPDVFIEITQNGSIKSQSTKRGVMNGMLTVSVYVKHLTTGAANNVKMKMTLDKFESIFSGPAKSGIFSYDLDPNAIVYQGKSLASGYSTKVLNVQVFINY